MAKQAVKQASKPVPESFKEWNRVAKQAAKLTHNALKNKATKVVTYTYPDGVYQAEYKKNFEKTRKLLGVKTKKEKEREMGLGKAKKKSTSTSKTKSAKKAPAKKK